MARYLYRIKAATLRLVLGSVSAQRARIIGTLMTMVIYLACVLAVWFGVVLGLTDFGRARVFTLILLINPSLFYIVIRCELDSRLTDKEMTMLQMMCAIVVMCIAYAILTPAFRSLTLLLVPLVMAFGMIGRFSLTPSQGRWLAVFTLTAYGSTMALVGSHWPAIFDPRQEVINFLILVAVVPTMSIVAAQVEQLRARMHEQRRALQATLAGLELLTSHDALTGLFNRRFMVERLAREQERLQGESVLTCIALVDLDHFKRINDQYGHAAGDDTLRRFGEQALRCLRGTDVIARWGGEEFLLLLSDTDLPMATAVLQRLRMDMTGDTLWLDRPELRVTISVGVVQWQQGETADQVVERADHLAYRAKNAGRDRVMSEQAVSVEYP
ncbi:diguanylate cyclase (GGDEF)-like protein [Rhodanobacter sp. K2T2]|uniref:diguanylate cyclase n=1 Tax=Rhodanobacter sp. K2T2 TaxID=2723085 RepID=UPI0015CECFF2|nr:diguanylate cyclase (GGDEF)-like protein [Rhodanobacter sp. K2T2]